MNLKAIKNKLYETFNLICIMIAHFIASFRFIRVFAAGATLICIRGACRRSAVSSMRLKLRSVKGNQTRSRMDYDDYIAIIRASGERPT